MLERDNIENMTIFIMDFGKYSFKKISVKQHVITMDKYPTSTSSIDH